MMNQRERDVVDRVDRVVRVLGTLTPKNPADVRAVSANLRIAVTASRELTQAIGALRCRDWGAVDYHLRIAEQAVAP